MYELLNDPIIRAALTRATLWACAMMVGAAALWMAGDAAVTVLRARA